MSNSDLPGLLGLDSLIANRAVNDFAKLRVYFAGPGKYDLDKALPPGTDTFKAERAPSGHMEIPCCEYKAGKPKDNDSSLSLLSRRDNLPSPPGLTNRYQ